MFTVDKNGLNTPSKPRRSAHGYESGAASSVMKEIMDAGSGGGGTSGNLKWSDIMNRKDDVVKLIVHKEVQPDILRVKEIERKTI